MNAHTVNYGQVSPVDWSMAGYTNAGNAASNHDSSSDCVQTIAGGKAVNTNYMPARYIRINSTGSTSNADSYTAITEIKAFEGSSSSTNVLSGIVGTGGTNMSGATDGSTDINSYSYAYSPANTPMVWDLGSVKNLKLILFVLLSSIS